LPEGTTITHMKRIGILALAVLLSACAPAAVAPPAIAPTAEPTASPTASPIAEPVATPTPVPSEPVGPTGPQIVAPKVALVEQAFAFGALPQPASAPAIEVENVRASLQGWTPWFAQVLTGYQGLYAADAQKQLELKAGFETLIAPGPFAEVVKIWVLRDAREGRTFTTSDATVLKVYAKPWGRAAYADIAFKLIETGGAQDSTRDLRVRITVGRGLRVIDAWDATTGRWLLGEAPQYSALGLESEAPSAVANYLYSESYAAGWNEQFASRPGLSTFLQARIDAINELNNAFKSHRMVDRHFEGTTVKLLRFDPATYLGDGVLTVLVSGKLVQTDGSGTTRTFPFSQQMKFLRSLRGGNPNLNAVDQQSPNGIWDSGGDLALYAVDIEFG
jgi:hypothetical protein